MNILNWFRAGRTGAGGGARARRAHGIRPHCEWLEERALLSADATSTSSTDLTAEVSLSVLSVSSTSPTGLTPAQILKAYGISGITFSNGTVTGDGAGQTIAIVDAYDDPDITSDLDAFDAEYGISAPPSFTVVNLGATKVDAGWALETALDVEWAHAIAPDANIVLVEASSDSLSALFGAVSYASQLSGVSVVSMSWGTSEFSSETRYDSVFTTPAGHENVTYVAASGDTGAADGVEYPAASPDVLAVGGTTLTVTSDGTYVSESAWSGSTGGSSLYESEPSYQTSALESVGLSDGVRTTPDVSLDADPDTGVSVYDSVAYDGQSGWFQIGGTSAAAPAWAGLVAIADQGLATAGVGTLSTTELLTDLYSLPSSDFNDITTGSNGYSSTAGYDLVTGLGSPRTDQLIAGLLAANGVSQGSTTTSGSDGSSSTGSSGSTVSVTSSSGSTTPSPTSTKHRHKKSSTKESRSHQAQVRREKVERARKERTKVRHASLVTPVNDGSVIDDPAATDSLSSGPRSVSASATVSSRTDSPTAAVSASLQSLLVSPPATLAAGIAVGSASVQQGQPFAVVTNPIGQGISPTLPPARRMGGGESRLQTAWAGDASRYAATIAARQPILGRSPVEEDIRSWPTAIGVRPPIDDLDLAIEILDERPSNGRLEPPTIDPDAVYEERADPGPSTIIATVALAAVGYRLAIREPVSRRTQWFPDDPATR